MSKHAVLALTECLHLDVRIGRHDHHIHVQAVLPGAVVSNIFESAGGVDDGDVAAAEAQRSAMLDIKAEAMDPLAAAETVFEQAAEGRFYLLTQPIRRVGHGRTRECACTRHRCSDQRRFDPQHDHVDSRWTPTPPRGSRRSATYRRCASAAWPRCGRGSNPRRCPTNARRWPASPTPPITRAGRRPFRVRIYRPTADSERPALVYFHGGGLVHGLQPLVRAAGARRWHRRRGATVVAVDYRLAPESRRPRSSMTPTPRPSGCRETPTNLGVDAGRLAVVGDSAGGSLAAAVALAARDRGGPADLCAGAAVSRAGSRHDRAVDHRAGRRADAQPRRHRLHARPRRRRRRHRPATRTWFRPMPPTCPACRRRSW